jgi:hypothetical protein
MTMKHLLLAFSPSVMSCATQRVMHGLYRSPLSTSWKLAISRAERLCLSRSSRLTDLSYRHTSRLYGTGPQPPQVNVSGSPASQENTLKTSIDHPR